MNTPTISGGMPESAFENTLNTYTLRTILSTEIQKKMNANIKIILIYADYNCATGFGYVAKQFIEELQKDENYKIVIHAINDFSEEPYEIGNNTMVFPARLNDKNDPYGRVELLRKLFQIDFDLFFILNDVEIVSQLIPHIKKVKKEKAKRKMKSFKVVTYTPIDSPVMFSQIKGFDYIDLPITYTEYAKNIMGNIISKLKKKIEILPHGINSKDFYPLDEKECKKAKIQTLGFKFKDSFVFGTVNRNQVRKDLGCILLAYKKFVRLNPLVNCVLYMHCNPLDPKGFNMLNACKRLGLDVGKDVIFPEEFNENSGVSISDLNKIYNMLDVFISTTTAEGWGLTVMEAMATKTPVIAPVHTSLSEVTNAGQLIEPLQISHESIFLSDFENIRYISDPKEVTCKMETLYNSIGNYNGKKKELNNRIEKAYKFTKGYNWGKISKEFKSKLDQLIKK